MYTRNHEFFFTQRPFECKFTLEGIRTLTNDKGAFKLGNAKKDQSIIVRKAGFLPETLSVAPGQKKYDNITLKRDPIENKIDEIMAGMTMDDMIAQMTQAKVPKLNCGEGVCGSALEGGGAYTADFYKSAWSQKIPATYGKDNVHGVADVKGATIFPHNIGLGAAFVRGQQGDHNDAEWRVITTIKHFIGDGATKKSYDRGNAIISKKDLYKKYLPPYEAAIEQGALSVMASFNQVNGIHQHIDSTLLTGVLKTELAFDGYVIADWEGIEHSTTPGAAGNYFAGEVTDMSSKDAIRASINAGLDMAMVPQSVHNFVKTMKVLLAEGNISEDRIKDACRRILRAKIRAGRIDNPMGPAAYVGVTKNIGSKEHRQIAREAVQKSLVILKNNKVLPLDTNGKVFVTGSEGAGVADVLYGKVKPTGKLPHTWPKDAKQIPINVGDGKKGLYPYGYGLTY